MWHLTNAAEVLGINYLFHTLEDLLEFLKKQPIHIAYNVEFIPVYERPQPRAEDELTAMREKHIIRPLSQT